jgi:hypothetical protein
MNIRPLLLVGLLALPALAGAQGKAVIPSQFRGIWAASADSCPKPEDDLLRIGAETVDFYESTGKVIAVRVVDKLQVELRLEMSGEGDTWRETLKLTLSSDLHSLADINSSVRPEHHYSRIRCS